MELVDLSLEQVKLTDKYKAVLDSKELCSINSRDKEALKMLKLGKKKILAPHTHRVRELLEKIGG